MTTTQNNRRLTAATMCTAATALVLGHLWNTPSTLTASRYVEQVNRDHGAFVAATLLSTVAALLLIPSAYGIAGLVARRNPRIAVAGSSLAAVGAAGLATGVSIIGFTMGMLTAHDTALAKRVYTIASHDGFVSLPFDVAPLFTIGTLVLAITLIRTRAVPLWQSILLAVGAVAAVGAPAGGALGALGHAPLALALVALAPDVWRSATRIDVMEPATSGVGAPA